jgi:hypothetical protein
MKALTILLIGLTISSCSRHFAVPGTVKHMKSGGVEITEVKSDEYGKSSEDATANAEKAAIKQFIFYGVAESPLADPMTTEGISLLDKHKEYFNRLFENNGYRKFITCSTVLTSEKIKNTKYHNTVHCCIAYRNLRMDLEKNGVIKKLGF